MLVPAYVSLVSFIGHSSNLNHAVASLGLCIPVAIGLSITKVTGLACPARYIGIYLYGPARIGLGLRENYVGRRFLCVHDTNSYTVGHQVDSR